MVQSGRDVGNRFVAAMQNQVWFGPMPQTMATAASRFTRADVAGHWGSQPPSSEAFNTDLIISVSRAVPRGEQRELRAERAPKSGIGIHRAPVNVPIVRALVHRSAILREFAQHTRVSRQSGKSYLSTLLITF